MAANRSLSRNEETTALFSSSIPESVDAGTRPEKIERKLRRDAGPEKDSTKGGSIWNGLVNLLAFLGPRILFGILVLLFIIWLSYLGLNMAGGMTAGEAALNAFPDTSAYVERLLHGDIGMTGIASGSLVVEPAPERRPCRHPARY